MKIDSLTRVISNCIVCVPADKRERGSVAEFHGGYHYHARSTDARQAFTGRSRCTPAIAAGVSDRLWSMRELIGR